MTYKTRKRIAIISTAIVCLMVGGSAVVKLLKIQKVVGGFIKIGVGGYLQMLGVSELVFLGLLLYPKTMRFGYFLLCGYFGGAIATQLSHGGNPFPPAAPLVFITLSVALRDRTFFAAASNQFVNS